ncbi:MAG: AI-2E family transporter [Nanoarchaeota archaeon]|nr:AI-2E family transporter [Nanoarchaeota archaeon]
MAPIHYRKYVLLGMLILLITLVSYLLKPFIRPVLGSLVLAYICFPLYKWLRKRVHRDWLAAALVSTFLVLLFALPVIVIVNSISSEVTVNYIAIKQVLATGKLMDGTCVDSGIGCKFVAWAENLLQDQQIKFYLTDLLRRTSDYLLAKAGAMVLQIPLIIMNFFIMLFVLYYLLKEGDTISYRLKRLLPLREEQRESIFKRLNSVTFAVMYGQLLVCAIQATIGGLFLWIFGVTSPLLWTLVMFFTALVPFLGTPIVWVPAMLLKFAQGEAFNGFGILIAGIFISVIDNFIRPKIVSSRASIHPIFVLLGVLGGISLFGFFGIIIGPVLLSIFMAFVDIFEEEMQLEAQS